MDDSGCTCGTCWYKNKFDQKMKSFCDKQKRSYGITFYASLIPNEVSPCINPFVYNQTGEGAFCSPPDGKKKKNYLVSAQYSVPSSLFKIDTDKKTDTKASGGKNKKRKYPTTYQSPPLSDTESLCDSNYMDDRDYPATSYLTFAVEDDTKLLYVNQKKKKNSIGFQPSSDADKPEFNSNTMEDDPNPGASYLIVHKKQVDYSSGCEPSTPPNAKSICSNISMDSKMNQSASGSRLDGKKQETSAPSDAECPCVNNSTDNKTNKFASFLRFYGEQQETACQPCSPSDAESSCVKNSMDNEIVQKTSRLRFDDEKQETACQPSSPSDAECPCVNNSTDNKTNQFASFLRFYGEQQETACQPSSPPDAECPCVNNSTDNKPHQFISFLSLDDENQETDCQPCSPSDAESPCVKNSMDNEIVKKTSRLRFDDKKQEYSVDNKTEQGASCFGHENLRRAEQFKPKNSFRGFYQFVTMKSTQERSNQPNNNAPRQQCNKHRGGNRFDGRLNGITCCYQHDHLGKVLYRRPLFQQRNNMQIGDPDAPGEWDTINALSYMPFRTVPKMPIRQKCQCPRHRSKEPEQSGGPANATKTIEKPKKA